MPESRNLMVAPPEFRAREAGVFFQQLEDQTRRLTEDTRGLDPSDLEWQPAPGANTIGMLLAHIAIVEVFWIQVALGRTEFDYTGVIGIGEMDDGIPLSADAPPPAALKGRELAYFDDLLARARAHTRQALVAMGDADLEREVRRTRADGSVRVTNVRWILYHLVEHQAGHYGQINLLRHLQRATAGTR
jgi:uncharacterized damage-inducible protein DinB